MLCCCFLCCMCHFDSRFDLGIIPRRHSNDYIDEHAEAALQVGGLAIAQEIPHDQNGQDNQNYHEDLKVHSERYVKTPGHNDR